MSVLSDEKRRAKGQRDLTAGYLPITDRQLHSTGIRGVRLFLLIFCIVILWLMAVGTFVTNLLLIIYLQIGARGIPFLQFLRTTNGTSLLQFSPPQTHFERLSTPMIGGWWGQNLPAEGQTINISTNGTTALEVQGNLVRMVGFSVRNSAGKMVFDSKKPTMRLASPIKKLSAKQIITNRIRSPIGKDLNFIVEDVTFRGNEGNIFEGKSFNMTASKGHISLKTENLSAVRINGAKGIKLSSSKVLPITKSHIQFATEDAFRICVCRTSHKLFTVPGNTKCRAGPSVC